MHRRPQEVLSRSERFEKALRLDSTGRALIGPFSEHFFSTRQAGISNKDAMLDHARRFHAMKDTVARYDFDVAPASGVYPAQLYQAVGAHYFKWPGDGLGDNLPFQFVEKEYMLAEEYDQFLADPDDFTVRVLWPRMTRGFEPASTWLPVLSFGPDPIFVGGAFTTETSRHVLNMLLELGQETQSWNEAEIAYCHEIEAMGYPVAYAANFTPPFDLVADYLRGLRGVMLDMYRRPDKLLAAVEVYIQPQIDSAIAWAEAASNPRVVFWLHRGSAGFMSNEQYERFYWPSLRKVVLALIDAGLTPILHAQGDYTPRLPFLAELPSGKVPIHYDRIDRQQAKKVMRDRQCFWGNVASSLLVTGSPKMVEDDVKNLIDLFGPNGGLIIDGNVGLPDEAKSENVAAMSQTAATYGVS